MALVAAVGAAGVIVAQRLLMATELWRNDQRTMSRWGFGAVLEAAVIDDKTYAVTPATMRVKAGIVLGSGRVAARP